MGPIDETIEFLILSGAIENVGTHPDTGEPTYKINASIKNILPELYEEHLKEVNRSIMTLWEKGFLNINLLTDDPIVSLEDKSFDQEEIAKIPIELQIGLSEIKRLLVK